MKIKDRFVHSKFSKLWYLTKKSFYFAWHRHHFLIPPSAMKKYIKSFLIVLKRGGSGANLYDNEKKYNEWLIRQRENDTKKTFSYNPLISVIIPVYNVNRNFLKQCVDSVLCQSYSNFEICIADDCSTNNETISTLKEYMSSDDRIKVLFRKENGMISECSNSAISISKGEFIALLDNDDVLEPDALYYVVEALNNKKYDLIYTDEDKMNEKNLYFNPHFKPDWSPDTFMAVNYICHFTVIRKSILNKVGLFRKEYDGAQDYDLFLRITDVTNNIYHIPKILYHWRETSDSTASYMGNKSYAYNNGKKALEDTLKRRNIWGSVKFNPIVSTYLVEYKHSSPLVSIIIPTRDQVKLLKQCVDSLYNKCKYKNFEIIIADNDSNDIDTLEFFDAYKFKYKNFYVEKVSGEFNYSYINNYAVKKSHGDYLLLLNNDTKVIDGNFLDEMVGYASQKHVGCVGIKLLYGDNRVQHAGVVLGYGGVAGHVFVASSKFDPGLFGRLVMPYNYSAVTAACLLISRKKYDEVNGLDEKLKVALNDVDFNLKLLNKGYYNVVLSYISMYHFESKTRGYEVSKEKQQRFLSEQKYISKKWGDFLDRDRFFSENNI